MDTSQSDIHMFTPYMTGKYHSCKTNTGQGYCRDLTCRAVVATDSWLSTEKRL